MILPALLALTYHSNLRPIAAGDSLPTALIPFSILLDHTTKLDRFGPHIRDNVWYHASVVRERDGHWHSVYPSLGPVLTTPLYLPILLVPGIANQSPAALIAIARVAEKGVAVLVAVAAAMLMSVFLGGIAGPRAAWWLTLVFALGTGNWSTSSQALWQHTYSPVAIIGCLYFVDQWRTGAARSFWLAGALAGIAFALRPTNGILLPALVVALIVQEARRSDAFRAIGAAALVIAAVTAYNLSIWGTATGGYGAAFQPRVDTRLFEALAGMMVSPGRGLLIYTPVVAFAVAAFARAARASLETHRAVAAAAVVFCAGQFAAVAMWPHWWGGYCWGPRLLTEVYGPAMALIAVGLPAIGSRVTQRAFAGAALYGCLIQAIGVYCYPKGHWDHLPAPVNDTPARLWHWRDNPIARTVRGGVAWEPYAVVWSAATEGLPAAGRKLRELGIDSF